VALIVGCLIFGSLVGLYSLLASVYPAAVRNTGAGLSVGMGRIGAIASPWLAGVLLERGGSGSSIYVVFALPLIVASAATFLLERLCARDREEPAGPVAPPG